MNDATLRGRPASAAELIERARALAPVFAERAAEAEELRRLPDQSVRDLEASDLCKIWIPARFGGIEADLATGLDILFEIARGCASSAWCLSVWQQHAWIMANFPIEAQKKSLSAEPHLRASAVLAPRGTARHTGGGFTLSGVWPFASGVDHANWILLGAQMVDKGGAPEQLGYEIFGNPAPHTRLCMLPTADVTITGDWHVAGLAGTGSHTVKVDDVFVPEHRTFVIPDAVRDAAPAGRIHDGTIFQATYVSFMHTALCGPAPGVAQGMLDHWISLADSKIVQPMGAIQASLVRTHRQVAESDSKIQLARLLLRDSAERITAAAEAGRSLDAVERAICRRNSALAGHLSYEAGEIVFFAAGGSHLALKSPLQRGMRDLHAIKAHYFMDLDTAYEVSGLTRLGRDPYTFTF